MGRINRWIRARGYADREAYVYTYYTGGTKMNLYMSQATWFSKSGRGVMSIVFYWRSPYELDYVALQKGMCDYMRERHGAERQITVITPLSLYAGRRVIELQTTFRFDERPSEEEMQRWLDNLNDYDLFAFRVDISDAC